MTVEKPVFMYGEWWDNKNNELKENAPENIKQEYGEWVKIINEANEENYNGT